MSISDNEKMKLEELSDWLFSCGKTKSAILIEKALIEIAQGKPKVSRKLIEEISYYTEWKDKDELRNDILPNKVLPKLGLEVEVEK